MKKTVSILLALLLVLSLCTGALADEFTLHSGIVFGDTLETVKEKEAGKMTIQDGSKDKTNKVWFNGTIAGMEGHVRYDFDEDTGKLIEMLYTFNGMPKSDECDDAYKTLKDGLLRKYGSPLGNTGGTIHIITGQGFEYAAMLINLYESTNIGSGDIRDYDEWIVECDGYYVKIDLVSFYIKASDTDYKINLSYHYFTDKDRENAVQEKKNKENSVDDDL